MSAWAVLGESAMGTSHRTRNTPCQDAFRYRVDADTFTIAVADGAGSASHSEQGATLVCDLLVNWHKYTDIKTIRTETGIRYLFALAHDVLVSKAEELGIRPRELACTALFAYLQPAFAVFAQLGDGAIVIDGEDGYRTVFWPEPTEYANATDFLSDEQYEQKLLFQVLEGSVGQVAVTTDGLQRLALDFANRTPHPGFFRPLFQRLLSEPNTDNLQEPFRGFLDSPAVNAKTDDDKTLVLAALRT